MKQVVLMVITWVALSTYKSAEAFGSRLSFDAALQRGDRKAYITDADSHGKTLLHYLKDAAVIGLLIDRGADVNARDNDGKTPLHLVRDVKAAQLLIDQRADVNAQDADGRTPLYCACESDNVGLIKTLLHAGAEANTPNNDQDTPLHCVDNPDMVELLVQHKADVDARGKYKSTPLVGALICNWIDAAKKLIESGADVNLEADNGLTALLVALDGVSNRDIVRILIERGADLNTRDEMGRTFLMLFLTKRSLLAGRSDMVEFLEFLRQRVGLDVLRDLVNERDHEGKTLLDHHNKAFPREAEVCKVFLESYGFDDSPAASVLTKSAAKR